MGRRRRRAGKRDGERAGGREGGKRRRGEECIKCDRRDARYFLEKLRGTPWSPCGEKGFAVR